MKFILIILLIIIASCSNVTEKKWNKCKRICTPNKGINYITPYIFEPECHCKNGTSINIERIKEVNK
jgi:hypothetical protein